MDLQAYAVEQAADSGDAGSDSGGAPHGWRWEMGDGGWRGQFNPLPEPLRPLSEGITQSELQGCLSLSPEQVRGETVYFSPIVG